MHVSAEWNFLLDHSFKFIWRNESCLWKLGKRPLSAIIQNSCSAPELLILGKWLWKKSVFDQVVGSTVAPLPKKILYSYFSKILIRVLEELHFRITFWGISTFAEYHRAIASKVKSEIAIHNSAKCFSSHEKMKKVLFST